MPMPLGINRVNKCDEKTQMRMYSATTPCRAAPTAENRGSARVKIDSQKGHNSFYFSIFKV